MNYNRIALASVGAFVAYFVLGGLAFGLLPTLRDEFRKYRMVYRSQDSIKTVMPAGMAFMLLAMVVLADGAAIGGVLCGMGGHRPGDRTDL